MFGRSMFAALLALGSLSATIAPAAVTTAPAKELILGKWAPSDNGVVTYEFRTGGAVTVTTGGMCIPTLTGSYTFTGPNQVELKLSANGRAIIVPLTIDVTRATLKTTTSDGTRESYKRAKCTK